MRYCSGHRSQPPRPYSCEQSSWHPHSMLRLYALLVVCASACFVFAYVHVGSASLQPSRLTSDELRKRSTLLHSARPPRPPLPHGGIKQPPPTPAPPAGVETGLLSNGRPATASVRGNLGPASVVTSGVTADWLKDRWQAASNMQGTPIPGEHWVAVELATVSLARSAIMLACLHASCWRSQACNAARFVLDWETARADDYELQARRRKSTWIALPTARTKRTKLKRHVVDELEVRGVHAPAEEYRVLIRRAATSWGVSLWRFEVWGTCRLQRLSPALG